ncbi:hypothetical protein EMCG_08504 [[Emmonsia] crescens]|uniref:Uncharacterized protein n=1 Tax=[Emmonsia] crescens TaxID=73230 RepID=A0A0G2I5Z6_9EURO|nr:hypothetical protein EMCG_08504 [Emmonsia crescens UAMH 3008]
MVTTPGQQYALYYMKFSGATVLALLATAVAALPVDAGTSDAPISPDTLLAGPETSDGALARGWDCDNQHGSNHQNLKYLHSQFNRRFGTSKLHMARNQCYILECNKYYFGVCNAAARDVWEVSGDRNIVAGTNPGKGSRCAIKLDPVNNHYLSYLYTLSSEVSLGGLNNVVRKC